MADDQTHEPDCLTAECLCSSNEDCMECICICDRLRAAYRRGQTAQLTVDEKQGLAAIYGYEGGRADALHDARAVIADLPTWWGDTDTPTNVEGERDACWHDDALAAIDKLRGDA